MAQVYVKYNPYRMDTKIFVNGNEISDDNLLQYVKGKRLQEWVGGFPEQLTQALRNPGYQAYLIAAGYEVGASAEAYLHRLEQRLNTQKTFPHEIGVFLGYPLEDILGFVLNKGTDCKYSGYWKVYGDVPKARSIFAAYEHFRDIILQKLATGMSLKVAVATL